MNSRGAVIVGMVLVGLALPWMAAAQAFDVDAAAFRAFLLSRQGRAIFARHGFSAP